MPARKIRTNDNVTTKLAQLFGFMLLVLRCSAFPKANGLVRHAEEQDDFPHNINMSS